MSLIKYFSIIKSKIFAYKKYYAFICAIFLSLVKTITRAVHHLDIYICVFNYIYIKFI